MAGVLVWLCVLTLASGEVLGLHDGNFADETSRGEWAVEFYAPWCSHCRALEPVWRAVARELEKRGSRVRVAKVDATLNPDSSRDMGVMAYPAIYFLRNGELIAEYKQGSRDKTSFVEWILELEVLPDHGDYQPMSGSRAGAPIPSGRGGNRRGGGGPPADTLASAIRDSGSAAALVRKAVRFAPLISASGFWIFGFLAGTFVGVAWALQISKKIA